MSKRDASEMLQIDGPPSKMIKTEGPKPIVFTSPGMKTIDTRIVVFSQEFHVNSDALKMLSVFFKNFMDPQNKAQVDCKPSLGRFKYEWFTKVETDGNWCLTDDPKERDGEITGYIGDMAIQEKCFHNLLCAIFSRQSVGVADVTELCHLTELAGYYLCLPAVSNSLYATLLNNESLSRSIANDPLNALNCAYDLRHDALFREAFVYALGPWSSPRFKLLGSSKLRALGYYLQTKMVTKLHGIDTHLRLFQANKEVYGDGVNKYFNSILSSSFQGAAGEEGNIIYPHYYRRLNNNFNRERLPDNLSASIRRTLEPILKNKLRLDTAGIVSGAGNFKDGFLCFEILDEELPWDKEELDWEKPSSDVEDMTQLHLAAGSWLLGSNGN